MANVFLSYQQKHQKTVVKLRDALKSRGYATVLGSDDKKAVENAGVVIMCMSAAYKANANCKKEIDEAITLNKPIIPINVEAGFQPSEWIATASGSSTVIDFSDTKTFQEKLEELLKELTANEIQPDAATRKKRKKKKEKDDDDNKDDGDGDGDDDGKGDKDKGGDDKGDDGDGEGGCCGGGEDGDDENGCNIRCVCSCIYRYLRELERQRYNQGQGFAM